MFFGSGILWQVNVSVCGEGVGGQGVIYVKEYDTRSVNRVVLDARSAAVPLRVIFLPF